MDEKPYLCPHCRANRVNFRRIRRVANIVNKDAFDGSIVDSGMEEPYLTQQGEHEVECLSCHFIGYEAMFIKAAEREPRVKTIVQGRA